MLQDLITLRLARRPRWANSITGAGRAAFYRLLLPALILALWEILYGYHILNPIAFTVPSKVLPVFLSYITSWGALEDVAATLGHVLGGFSLAAITGVVLGVIIGGNRHIEHLTESTIELWRPLPALSVLPFSIIWFGIGFQQKIFLIYVAVWAPILVGSAHAIKNIPMTYVIVSQAFAASHKQMVFKTLLPAAMPGLFTALRVGLGLSFQITVAAELVASQRGVAHMLVRAWRVYDMEGMVVGIIVLALMGYSLELLSRKLRVRILSWQKGQIVRAE